MGTRSLTHIKEDDGTTIATIYRQYDGYPSGIGADIRQALNSGQVELRNGFSGGDEAPKQFNGMGCLGAFLVGALKENKIGNVYLMSPDIEDVGEEYVYTLTPHQGTVNLKVVDTWKNTTLYDGILAEFDPELIE
jgi:hypothetical protein